MSRLTESQIKDLQDNYVCPNCGEQEIVATVTAPEQYQCANCGWWEFVEVVDNM